VTTLVQHNDAAVIKHDFHVQWFVIVNKRVLINAITHTLSVLGR